MPGKWRQGHLGKDLDCENSIWRLAYFLDFSRLIFPLVVKSEIVFLETTRLWDITDGALSSLSRHLRVKVTSAHTKNFAARFFALVLAYFRLHNYLTAPTRNSSVRYCALLSANFLFSRFMKKLRWNFSFILRHLKALPANPRLARWL